MRLIRDHLVTSGDRLESSDEQQSEHAAPALERCRSTSNADKHALRIWNMFVSKPATNIKMTQYCLSQSLK